MPDKPGRCRICHCTWRHGCPGGCDWADGTRTICTVCAVFKHQLHAYLAACGDVSIESMRRMLREIRDDDARGAKVYKTRKAGAA